MASKKRSLRRLLCIVGVPVAAYFVIFPQDVEVLLRPILEFNEFVATGVDRAAKVSLSVSPWLYSTIMVGIAGWCAIRIWPRRPAASTSRRKKA